MGRLYLSRVGCTVKCQRTLLPIKLLCVDFLHKQVCNFRISVFKNTLLTNKIVFVVYNMMYVHIGRLNQSNYHLCMYTYYLSCCKGLKIIVFSNFFVFSILLSIVTDLEFTPLI